MTSSAASWTEEEHTMTVNPNAIDGETETLPELPPPPELSISSVVEYLSQAV